MELRETEYDAFTGETKKWYFDDNNNIVCERSADLSALISHCKSQANMTNGFNMKEKYHKVASIPPLIQHRILKEHNLDVFSSDKADQKRLEKILELEYPVLKTNSAKLYRTR